MIINYTHHLLDIQDYGELSSTFANELKIIEKIM